MDHQKTSLEMEDGKTPDHLTSAAAFVEGGIQDACDDACSICLEVFCDSDPSTLTTCKHEYHLQCILEWCQRSSQCPMCWQAISLKDPGSQELLDAVENERNIRMNPPRNTTIFHHPTLGDFELQHLPVNANDSELEERIIQHLAAAAAMGRARQLARREGQRGRSSGQGRPRYLVFSTHPDGSSTAAPTGSVLHGNNPSPAVMISGPNPPFITIGEDSADLIARPNSPQSDQLMATPTRSSAGSNRTSLSNRSPSQNSPSSQDRAGPSDFQAFSESVKSRLSTLSMRCKESITKNTRGWKDRLFTRNSSSPDPTTEVRGEVDERPTTVSRMMDHLQIGEESRNGTAGPSNDLEENSTRNLAEVPSTETEAGPSVIKHKPEACATGSSSN